MVPFGLCKLSPLFRGLFYLILQVLLPELSYLGVIVSGIF